MRTFWFVAILLVHSQIKDMVQPGTVTGRLLSVNGTPAANVRIAAVPVDDRYKTGASALFGITQTAADGRFRLENIPPGRYYIFAGLIDFPSYYPNATTLEGARAVVVNEGSTVSGIDFSMARPLGLTVAGRLAVPPTMQVRDGWSVTLTLQSRGALGNSILSKVGPDGSFEFLRVLPGDYRVASNLTGAATTLVKVVDADLVDVVLPVVDCNAGVLVSGRLMGVPSNQIASASLTGSRSGCTSRTSVERDGSFTFSRVPEGTYQLQLSPVPLGWSAMSLTVEKSDISGMQVQLPAAIAIKGQVEVENGSPVPRTSRGDLMPIRAVRLNGGEATTTIQDDGTFELLLVQGNYRISVQGIPASYYLKSMTSGFDDLQKTSLAVGDLAPSDIHLALGVVQRQQTGVRLSGRLSFASTGALPNPEGVVLVSTSGSRNSAIRESGLAPDGTFEFSDVSPGIYNLETFPDNPAAFYGIVVEKTDVTGIEYSLPILVKVKGGIEWPVSQGQTVTAAPSNVSVQFTRKEGGRTLAWGALANAGDFHFYLPEGDYRFSISGLPAEFNLDSVTSGDTNILESGLHVRSNSDPPKLRVTLRGK